MQEFFDKIQAECDRQNKKWGVRNQHPLVWLSILNEEIGEVGKEINEPGFSVDNLMLRAYENELVQCGAVICQMLKNVQHYKESQMSLEKVA